eukprot:gene6392-9594_t
MPTIKLTIKASSQQTHTAEGVETEWEVKELKDHLAPLCGVSADCQRLIYKGRVRRGAARGAAPGHDGRRATHPPVPAIAADIANLCQGVAK